MKIVIDCRFWGPTHTGLGVYTCEMVTNLSQIDKKNHYVLLVRKEMVAEIKLPANFSLEVVEAKPYTFKEQFLLAWKLWSLKSDLVHFPSINVPVLFFGKYVLTVHDLIKHQSRGKDTTTLHPAVYWFKYWVYRLAEVWVVQRASKIIVPSQTVEKQIKNFYTFAKMKTAVTHEAAVLEKSAKAHSHFDFPEKFAIYTGNAYPHKNLPRLVRSWKEVFEKTKTVLLISSGRSAFVERINKLIDQESAQNYVKFAGFLTNEQLIDAYEHASCYVFPSLMEGFGIPALDAMKLGLPVVCSDIPVFKEIYADAPVYFDPLDEKNMTEKIIAVLQNEKLRKEMAERGKKQAKKYSWKKLAEETVKVYNEVAGH